MEPLMQDNQPRLGEVVETTTGSFLSQCYVLYGAPPLGALVKSGGPYPAYGVVHEVATQGIDPSRRPVARGMDETSEEDVYRANPQLELLFRTDFRAVTVGHTSDGEVRHHLPPSPPPIYAFVHACTSEEVRAVTLDASFLHPLVGSRVMALEEVIAACLRQAAPSHIDPEGWLAAAGARLVTLLPGEFGRVQAILQRAWP